MCSHLFTALVSNLGVARIQVANFQKSQGKDINQPDFSYWHFTLILMHNWNLSKRMLHFPNTPCPVDKCIHTHTHEDFKNAGPGGITCPKSLEWRSHTILGICHLDKLTSNEWLEETVPFKWHWISKKQILLRLFHPAISFLLLCTLT